MDKDNARKSKYKNRLKYKCKVKYKYGKQNEQKTNWGNSIGGGRRIMPGDTNTNTD